MKPSKREDTLLRVVSDIYLAYARLFNHRAREYGLTRTHWQVIAGLYGHNGLTQTELANALAMARSPLGKVIDRLEEAELIERRPDPDDRRVKRVHLTPKVEPLVRPAQELIKELEAKALAGVPKGERSELLEHLLTIRAALGNELEQASGAADPL
jgi:DNA-binding MarR family transcriptional regulator